MTTRQIRPVTAVAADLMRLLTSPASVSTEEAGKLLMELMDAQTAERIAALPRDQYGYDIAGCSEEQVETLIRLITTGKATGTTFLLRDTPPEVAPAFDPQWDDTSGAIRGRMVRDEPGDQTVSQTPHHDNVGETQFRCAVCHGVFEKDWTPEEAEVERKALWPDFPQDECDQVCDDCFTKFMVWRNSEDVRP